MLRTAFDYYVLDVLRDAPLGSGQITAEYVKASLDWLEHAAQVASEAAGPVLAERLQLRKHTELMRLGDESTTLPREGGPLTELDRVRHKSVRIVAELERREEQLGGQGGGMKDVAGT